MSLSQPEFVILSIVISYYCLHGWRFVRLRAGKQEGWSLAAPALEMPSI
jgi:hypothetical protein